MRKKRGAFNLAIRECEVAIAEAEIARDKSEQFRRELRAAISVLKACESASIGANGFYDEGKFRESSPSNDRVSRAIFRARRIAAKRRD